MSFIQVLPSAILPVAKPAVEICKGKGLAVPSFSY